jgi:hypothetical protein
VNEQVSHTGSGETLVLISCVNEQVSDTGSGEISSYWDH